MLNSDRSLLCLCLRQLPRRQEFKATRPAADGAAVVSCCSSCRFWRWAQLVGWMSIAPLLPPLSSLPFPLRRKICRSCRPTGIPLCTCIYVVVVVMSAKSAKEKCCVAAVAKRKVATRPVSTHQPGLCLRIDYIQ